jgi:activator of HSP90 ATPase
MSQEQKLLFVVHVVYTLCCVAMKLHEQEETARQRGNEKSAAQQSDHCSQESLPSTEGTTGPVASTQQSAAHIHSRPLGEDSDSEILDDDDDGGVPLYSSSAT